MIANRLWLELDEWDARTAACLLSSQEPTGINKIAISSTAMGALCAQQWEKGIRRPADWIKWAMEADINVPHELTDPDHGPEISDQVDFSELEKDLPPGYHVTGTFSSDNGSITVDQGKKPKYVHQTENVIEHPAKTRKDTERNKKANELADKLWRENPKLSITDLFMHPEMIALWGGKDNMPSDKHFRDRIIKKRVSTDPE